MVFHVFILQRKIDHEINDVLFCNSLCSLSVGSRLYDCSINGSIYTLTKTSNTEVLAVNTVSQDLIVIKAVEKVNTSSNLNTNRNSLNNHDNELNYLFL